MTPGPQAWLPTVIERLAQVPAVVRIVVAQVQGSTPREPGAYMLVDAAGHTGTIGGGRLEWEALAAAREMLQQGTRCARLMNRVLGIDLGQCCGGVVAAWLECFPEESLPQLRALEGRLAAGPVVLSTSVSAAGVCQSLSGEGELAPTAAALLALPRNQASPRVARTREGELAFFERLDEQYPAVWLYGAGHVGQALAGMLVQLPLRLLWQDSRTGQFPPGSFEYSRVLAEPELVRSVNDAVAGTYFVVMTHDHGLDYDLCRAVLLREDSAWLGLIGSQSKGARFRSRLRRDGLGAQAIEHLVCPIGITGVNSKWPAAIAVAIAAQLMQLLSQPAAGPLIRAVPGGPLVACAAGDCENCGGPAQKSKGTVVTQT
ncbi:MAG TPA: xanthine dehydrogenase accessory protein XdhC [Steroidobacteraceae bacterium]|nr:xanthine dehydrogenase accessory protein XdhC [Steroidobacteraceae bacterium]